MNQFGSETVRASNRRRGGMTLVEVMIAMVILSFGLLGVAALQVRAITEGNGGRHLSTASAVARNRIEMLTRQAWGAVVLNDTAGAWTAPTNIVVADQTFAQSERITNNAAVAATIKAIEVRVLWSDSKRQNRSVVLSSARLKEPNE